MSEALLDWPNGVLGMILGVLAGGLVVWQACRNSPWDIHDENSYREPARMDIWTVAPSLILFSTLLTLLFGLGALDKGIWWPLAIAGDVLGVAAVALAGAYVVRDYRTTASGRARR